MCDLSQCMSWDLGVPITPQLIGSSQLLVAAGSGTQTLNPPAGTESGDLAILFIVQANTSTPPSTPSGWTDLGSTNATNESAGRVCYKAGPAGVGITAGASSDTTAVMLVFRSYGSFPGTTPSATASATASASNPAAVSWTPGVHDRTLGAAVFAVMPAGAGYSTARTFNNAAARADQNSKVTASQVDAAIFANVIHFHWNPPNAAGTFGTVAGNTITLSGTVSDRVVAGVLIVSNGAG